MYERFMHLAKVPNFVRRIMFELRLTQDIRVTIVRFLTSVLFFSYSRFSSLDDSSGSRYGNSRK